MGEQRTCKTCGNPIVGKATTYCSRPCQYAGRRTGKASNCEHCGKPIYIPNWEQNKGNRSKRYCSRECHHAGIRLTGQGYRWVRKDGYVFIHYPSHPDADRYGGRIAEHRLVAEQKYGRRILPTEHVHHINGIRGDNRPENLIIVGATEHAPIHLGRSTKNWEELEAELQEYRRRYGPLEGWQPD